MNLRERARAGLPLDDLRIVDVHGHAGPYSDFPVYRHDTQGMLATMDRCGIERIVVAPHIGIGPDDDAGNRLAARMFGESAGRIVPFCAIHPGRSERAVRAQLERWVAGGTAVGLKFHPSLHQHEIGCEAYRVALEYADRYELPVLVHTWLGCGFCSPAALCETARRYPAARFLMGHSGGIPPSYPLAAEPALETPNVWFDLTGSQSRVGAIERLVALVGHERVLFGSDLPFLDPRPKLGQVLFAELSDDAKRAILSGNARRVFRLPPLREGVAPCGSA